jgi:hypothetical protein
VALSKDGDQELFDDFLLPDNDFAELLADPSGGRLQLFERLEFVVRCGGILSHEIRL